LPIRSDYNTGEIMAHPVLRRIGYVAGALIGLVLVLAGVIYAVSSARLSRRYEVPADPVVIPGDSSAVARGAHLAQARLGCTACHGTGLGGQPVVESAMFGHFIAPNLTRGAGGLGAEFTDADWVRSIRHGVRRDGRSVALMPSDEFSRLSEEDLRSVIAYVKQVPPVDGSLPDSRPGPIARALLTFNAMVLPAAAIDHSAPFPAAPVVEASARYGNYLVSTGGCRGCHGPELIGGKGMEPGSPPPPNLTPAGRLATWTEADFVKALREGVRPDGSSIDPMMPWQSMGRMTVTELRAIFAYLTSLPPRPGDA
jgi:mono/diheme cytochrome c family protein